MAGRLNGVALGSVAVGSLLVWSGVKGASITTSLRDLITGQALTSANDPNVNAIGTPVTVAGTGAPLTALDTVPNNSLAADAMKYVGHRYVWGGAPGLAGTNGWDCSSFMNWVIGHDSGMAIPGYSAGSYNGTAHGPATGSWLLWSGVTGITAANAQPGDLVVGVTHMGMVTSPGNYISAHDPAEGTTVSPVSEFPDVARFYKRLNAVSAAAASARDTSSLVGG